MIRSHFGLQRNPFDPEAVTLLSFASTIATLYVVFDFTPLALVNVCVALPSVPVVTVAVIGVSVPVWIEIFTLLPAAGTLAASRYVTPTTTVEEVELSAGVIVGTVAP